MNLIDLLIICLILHLMDSHAHVVFEEFGLMAGSVSYMHTAVTINMTYVNELITTYITGALLLRTQVHGLQAASRSGRDTSSYRISKNTTSPQPTDITAAIHKVCNMIETYIESAGVIKEELRNIMGVLPADVERRPNRGPYRNRKRRSLKSQIMKEALDKGSELLMSSAKGSLSKGTGGLIPKGIRLLKSTKILRKASPWGLGFSLAKGIFGTFMGLYNAHQMEKLRSDLGGVIQKQNMMLEVLNDHSDRISALETKMQTVQQRMAVEDLLRPDELQAELNKGLLILKTAVTKVIHAVQEAHHHRLAVDYLTPRDLHDLYNQIQDTADQSKYKLLTKFPSDLFQLELSYLFDEEDVTLIIHVPMVPEESLLKLYRLKPFPIPFSDTLALLPKPSSALLALSQGLPRAMTSIEHADLIDCHQVSQVFLCERHGVLKNNVKSTCLGALFEQDIPVAQELCHLELVPYQEEVIQLKNNWFLIYSPLMYTGYVKCFNSTSSAIPIKVGINQIFIDPSCKLELKNHTLTSDLSMKLDAEITYFQWQLTDLAAFGVNEEDIQNALEEQQVTGEQHLFLSDVHQRKHYSSKFPSWKWIFAILIFTGLVTCFFFVFFSVGAHRVFTFRRRMRRIRDAVEKIKEVPILRHRPNAPPLYPGLPAQEVEEDEAYEFMQPNPRSMAKRLSKLSRTVSRMSVHLSTFRPRSLSQPGRSPQESSDADEHPRPASGLHGSRHSNSYSFLRATDEQ